MIKLFTLVFGTFLVMTLGGCKNTATAVGDTAKGAVHGTGEIIKGVGEGIDHIGQGMKKDIDDDDTDSAN
jgi:hypothetical protein